MDRKVFSIECKSESPKEAQNGASHKKPRWVVEWYVLAVFVILIFLAIRAHAKDKRVDELGLDLIDRVRVVWSTVKCDEWPDKNGEYPCTGKFYVHAQAIRAPKNSEPER